MTSFMEFMCNDYLRTVSLTFLVFFFQDPFRGRTTEELFREIAMTEPDYRPVSPMAQHLLELVRLLKIFTPILPSSRP